MLKELNPQEINSNLNNLIRGALKPINSIPNLTKETNDEMRQELLLSEYLQRKLVAGAFIVCTSAEDATSKTHMYNLEKVISALNISCLYKLNGGNITQKLLELCHKDIKFNPLFQKCSGCDNHICNPIIENGEWKEYDSSYTVGEGYGLNKDEAYMICLNGGGLLYSTSDGQRIASREVEIWSKEGRLVELSADYIDWLILAEGNKLSPYVSPNDNASAKSNKTVTLGIGVTFNMHRDATWDVLNNVLGWTDNDINTIINALFDRVPPGLNQSEVAKYTISQQESRDLLKAVAEDYMEQVNDAVDYINKQNGYKTVFKQNELEAMFDYAYNNGLSHDNSRAAPAIDDDEYIIYYYLRKDQEGAVDAIIKHGKNGNKRRLNQANLFFNNTYNFVDSSEKSQLDTVRIALGWPPDKL